MNRPVVITIIGITAAVWLFAAAVFGLPTTVLEAAQPFGTAITAATLFILGFNYYMWRWPLFRRWLRSEPDLKGAWRFELQTTWVDPATGAVPGPILGFAQIDQTATTLTLRIFSEKSRSKTLSWAFSKDHEVFELAIVYQNDPEIKYRDEESRIHKGAAIFYMRGYRPDSIEGEYWTERKSTGTLKFMDRREFELNSFSDGCEKYGRM